MVLQEGAKFMRHSKRSHLSTQDINNALRLRNVEVGYRILFLEILSVPSIHSQASTLVHISEGARLAFATHQRIQA